MVLLLYYYCFHYVTAVFTIHLGVLYVLPLILPLCLPIKDDRCTTTRKKFDITNLTQTWKARACLGTQTCYPQTLLKTLKEKKRLCFVFFIWVITTLGTIHHHRMRHVYEGRLAGETNKIC